MPPAARVGDMHICPVVTNTVPHVGGPILDGVLNVLIGDMPAATAGAAVQCVSPETGVVISGSQTVLINGRPAARVGDMTSHGGTIFFGCPTVLIEG